MITIDLTNQGYNINDHFKVLLTNHSSLPQYSRENLFIIRNPGLHDSQVEGPQNEYSSIPKGSEPHEPNVKAINEGKRKRDESCNKEEKCQEEEKLGIRVKS